MIIITYRWWERVVVRRVVIGCVYVWWVLYFTLHSHVLPRLSDALQMDVFLVVTTHMRVLEHDTDF
jgi:hypothetical protein